ncbi:hypothetical protein [Schinkia azotoformans]|uniref:hypothetical protein n=1 Tax=Schinkia azotoformans TaxID=1454 RepID=UPI002DBFB147|nr:hypothetical protein [Schinkia azotoformans]MEC1759855.1 hypothetical protein [Schinkia azotoformans]
MKKRFYKYIVVPLLIILGYPMINNLPESLKPYIAVTIMLIAILFGWRDLIKARDEDEIRRFSVTFSLAVVFFVIGILSLIF